MSSNYIQTKSVFLCFLLILMSFCSLLTRILDLALEEQNEDAIESAEDRVQLVILDMSSKCPS